MVSDDVEAAGETGEGHPGHRTVNEEAVEHVEHDTGVRTMTVITNEETCREGEDTTEFKQEDTNGEQAESVIETEHPGEELLAHCTLSDEVAGSTVLHVSRDMNEREKNDEEAEETAAAKETEEISKEDVEIRRLIEERRNTPKE